MKTVLMLVEDKKFIQAISNYFRYLKYSVRVVPKGSPLKVGESAPDLIIFQVNVKEQGVLSVIKKIQCKLPGTTTLYLAASRNPKLHGILTKHKIIVMTETEDLDRVYKRIERLRVERKLERKKVSQ